MDDLSFTDRQKQGINKIRIIKATNVSSLKKAISANMGIILTVLDCNIPDTKGSSPHDQLLKTNHRITGQHKSLDIVIENLPNTPITMLSSLHRFQKLVSRYYKNTHDLDISIINKSNQPLIRKSIGDNLRAYFFQ